MGRRAYLKQTAKELGVAEYYLRNEAKAKRMPCIMCGNRYIFDIEQCEEFLKNKALENIKNDGGKNSTKHGKIRRVEIR
jgi:hypothetical protein